MQFAVSWILAAALAAAPESWPAFLGQGASTVDPASIPAKWSPVENIAWKTKLPGKGQSSPVILGDTIYVTSIDGTMKERCQIVALQLADGAIAWQQTFESSQPVRSNYFQSRSAPTPIVDEHGVYAFFETGNLVALSHDGEVLWQRSLTEDYGPFESTIGLAASPLQAGDSLVLLIDHEGPSYLLAVDKRTGVTRWKTDRDSRTSYSSPALVPVGDSQQIVCSSAGSLDGYEPVTGKQLWTVTENIGGNRSATPLAIGDGRFVIAASPGMHNENEAEARQTNGIVAIEPDGDGFQAKVVWQTEEAMPAFNSPTVYRGLAYWVNRAGVIFCYDAQTGEKHYAKRIGQGCWATPVGIGDRLYVFGKDGLTTVLAVGKEFEVLAENQLWNAEEAGNEAVARNRAAGREEGAEGRTGGGRPSGNRAEGGSPAGAESSGQPGREAGGQRPAMTAEERERNRAQGENRFADPVQYGVAIVSGSLIIRTGEFVYCLRNASARP